MSDLSLEATLALCPPDEREQFLADVGITDLADLAWNWRFQARPSQWAATRAEEALILFLGGRGAGKSRAGAEWIKEKVQTHPKPETLRFALVGRTAADVRDVMVKGDSGLLSIFPASEAPVYVANTRSVTFQNGAEALMFSAEEPDQLRGPQFHYSWCDEVAAWRMKPGVDGLTAWENTRIATRLGARPQVFATTTPKRVPLVRDLVSKAALGDPTISLHRSTTYDNPFLSLDYLDLMRGLYGATRLGAQELMAQVLDEVEGALWSPDVIERNRVTKNPLGLYEGILVVGVDPSVADRPRDECGIVVVQATDQSRPTERHAYVLDDRSGLMAPSQWAKAVVKASRDFGGAPVVAEANQGGALVREVVHSVDRDVRVRLVHARMNKALRAEPVLLPYDQGRVHHVNYLSNLEDQLTTWVPNEDPRSPDRLDALVHALTAVLVPSQSRGAGRTRVSTGALGASIERGALVAVRSRL